MNKSTEELDQQILETVLSDEWLKAAIKEGGFGCRVSLRFNGKEMLGTSIPKAPENHEELIEFLKKLVGFLEAPDVEDKELLPNRTSFF